MKTGYKILIGLGATLVVSSAIAVPVIKIRNKRIEESILKQLSGGVGQYGTLEDFPGFKGKVYQDSVPKNQNIIKLKDEIARQYADKIDKAWGYANDDEEGVYQVFRELKDQYQLSQIASSYNAVYKVPLLQKLKEKLSDSEQDVIYKIGVQYKPYRTT